MRFQRLACMALLAVVLQGCSVDINDDFHAELTAGYELIRTSSPEVVIENRTSSESPSIPAKVDGVGWNDRFIIAKQQVMKSRGLFKEDNYPIPDEGHFAYWIIDIKQNSRTGPLSKQEFDGQVQKLGLGAIKMLSIGEVRKWDRERSDRG